MYVFNFKTNQMEKGQFSYQIGIDAIPGKEVLVANSSDYPYNWTESKPFTGREPIDNNIAQTYINHFESVYTAAQQNIENIPE